MNRGNGTDMEPEAKLLKLNKTAFIPYRLRAGKHEYYLQRRDASAPTHPGMLSMFGGSAEPDELPEQCVLREVQEELQYVPLRIQYFGSVERIKSHCDVFIEEVGDDFETRVVVCEGECGLFVTAEEATRSPANPLALVVLESLEESLTKN